MSRRMGLESGRGDKKGRNLTPAGLDAKVAAEIEGEGECKPSVHDHDVPIAEERKDDIAPASKCDGLVSAQAASDANVSGTSNIDSVNAHDCGLISDGPSAVTFENSEADKDEDGIIENKSEYESEDDNEEDYQDDESEDEHNESLFLLEEESEVVIATAVSMKRFGSTDLLSECKDE